jgi:peptidoglycan/xylan/chitin deacetylase (PgdA/CDA1 family)
MSAPLRSRARSIATRLLDFAPFAGIVQLLERADRGRPDVLGVLTYHRVDDPGTMRGHPGLISATPGQFAEQMAYVASRFRPVSLDELLAAREGGAALPPRAVMVTFDDAYRDFADRAWPVLQRHGVPATLFVPTAFPGRPDLPFWWDWLHEAVIGAPAGATLPTADGPVQLGPVDERAGLLRDVRGDLKRQPHATILATVAEIGERLGCPPTPSQVLGWDDLRALAADGVALAPHSRTHPLLDRVEPETRTDELQGAIADLEQHIGAAPRALAYPSGAYSPAVQAAAVTAGYALAFTTRRGLNRLGRTDWLGLRRINVGSTASANVLRAQLGRWALAWS